MEKELAVIQTASGPVRGRDAHTFLGIPYGKASRFCPPEPVYWTGVRDCSEFGSVCAQPNFLGVKPEGVEFQCLGSEDGLNLNIWTPDANPDARLPVVVFVHGGGLQTGSNQHPDRTGEHFCGVRDLVFVSVNYRLGVLGGLYLGHLLGKEYGRSGSIACLDVLEAIRWVKANAAAFGGDPERITVMGISAGAKVIASLLTLPEANGLFRQVWLESGATQAMRSKRVAEAITQGYLAHLPGKNPRDLLTLPAEELVRAQAELCNCPYSTVFFGAVLDDGVFSSRWQERWEAGEGWKGRAVLGSGRREMYAAAHQPGFPEQAPEIFSGCFGKAGGDAALADARRLLAEHPEEEPADIWTQVYSDYMYRAHTDRLAFRLMRQGNPVWLYSFEFWPGNHGLGMAYTMRMGTAINGSARHFAAGGTPQTPELPCWKPLTPEAPRKLYFDQQPSVHGARGDALERVPEYNYNA